MLSMTKELNLNNNIIERIEVGVKWYNPVKGYGFLIHDKTLEDIMIHFSSLETVKCPYIKEGDRIVCDIGNGKRGLQVLRVIEVKYGSPEPRSLSSFLGPDSTLFDPESLEEIKGILKWYNPEKGYGFVLPDDGGREIFLHSSVIRKAGYKSLHPGLRVLVKISQSERGPEARVLIVLIDEGVQELMPGAA
jgi:CspA family cold shock protein